MRGSRGPRGSDEAAGTAPPPPRTAEVLVSGRIATLAGDQGAGWVEAIAIGGGRVLAAGTLADLEGLTGRDTRRLVLAPGQVAIPGLTDAHLHLVDAALAQGQVQLEGAGSIDDLTERVRQFGERAGGPGWITGGGWDPDALGRWPVAADLDQATPGRLVALWAHDHHALLASEAALAAAGLDAGSADPAGGVIRRGPDGAPTGVLHENAARLVADLVPAPTVEDITGALVMLAGELLALGVIAVHDPGGLATQSGLGSRIEAYRRLAAVGELGLRVHACIRPGQLSAAATAGLRSGGPMGPDPRGRLRTGWLKTFADGSLGSRTAALLEPVAVGGDSTAGATPGSGVWMTEPEVLLAQVQTAAAAGIATQIHAIGDAAVRAALEALAGTAGRLPLMPRVEHAQLVDDADVGRFGRLGIAASVQPVHIRSDAEKVHRSWGTRAEDRAFPLAALAAGGAVVAFGTDAPVEPINPWPGLACAVTRAAPTWDQGTPPLGRGQALSLWRAVRAACVDPALSAGERDRGRLVAGQRADMVVVPAAALAEPVGVGDALWHARPALVLVDGEPVVGG